jgi:hypothetical protein
VTAAGVSWRDGRCPGCGYSTDAVSQITGDAPGAEPEIGDATICLNCAHVMIFTAFGTRSANAAELADVLAVPDLVDAIAWIHRRGFIPGYRR